MTRLTRLIAHLLLPLLLLGIGYLLFYRLGEGVLDELSLRATAITLSALLAAIPPLLFRFLILSQLKEGFALLQDGRVVTPTELSLSDVLGHRITAWMLFQQHLDTEICLQGDGELLYIPLGLDFSIPANQHGKAFIRHYQHNMTQFEAWLQRTLFIASCRDREMASSLGENTLLNEEDERILRHKFLRALRAQPQESVLLPLTSSCIQLNRDICRREKLPAQEGELDLDRELLHELGIAAGG